jgi:hypothetical protein
VISVDHSDDWHFFVIIGNVLRAIHVDRLWGRALKETVFASHGHKGMRLHGFCHKIRVNAVRMTAIGLKLQV